MNISKMDLNLLKVVSAIAKTGSVSGAATQLNVTQPAISNSLTRLRQLTGDKIFFRSQGAQQATHFGLKLIATSNNVLDTIESCLLLQDTFDPLVMERTFNLSIQNALEVAILPKILSHFQKYPKINFKIFHSSPKACLIDLKMGKTDLTIGIEIGPYKPDGICSELLFTDQLKLVVRQGHPLSTKKTISEDDFLALEHIIVRADNELYSPELMLRGFGIYRRIACEVPNPIALTSITAETDYSSIALKKLSKPMIDLFNLKTFSLPFKLPSIDVLLGYEKQRLKDAGVLWLKEELKLTLK